MSTASPRPQAADRQRSAPLDAAAPARQPRRRCTSPSRQRDDARGPRGVYWPRGARLQHEPPHAVAQACGTVQRRRGGEEEGNLAREFVHVGTPRLSLSSPMLRCARIAHTFMARNPCAAREATACASRPSRFGRQSVLGHSGTVATAWGLLTTASHARTGARVCRRTPDAHMRAQAHGFFSAKRR